FAGSGGGYLDAGPWLSVTGTRGDTSGNEGLYNPGPGHSGGYTAFATTSGVQNVSIVLNTTTPQWTFQVFNNGNAVSSVVTLASNPSIVGVAIGDNGSPMANGTVSDFSLTATPVPEPATLGLASIGAISFFLVKRRRRA
ncbi:MAG: PEP-CTERM sorting domain-containing protein, partial [Phycisphaerae bacterium]